MKKIGKIILALSMLLSFFSPSISILAAGIDTEKVEQVTPKNTTIDTQNKQITATGNLEIDVKFVLPLPNVEKPNIGIIISDEQGNKQIIDFNTITVMNTITYNLGTQSGDLALRKLDKNGLPLNGTDDSKIVYYGITLYNLEKGSYFVTLYGNGYKTITEKVVMDEYAKRISISNTTGMFEVGDVNKDNVVDEKDINDVIAHFNQNDANYDLNRDGKVDIADLAYIKTTINGTKNSSIITNTSVMLDDSVITMNGAATGDLSDLLKDNGSVSIKPTTENEISKDNAAILNLDMKQPIEMKQLRLETGLNNIPEEMTIVITDESGNVYNIEKTFSANNDIHSFTDKANPNTIVIDLEGQIAVKKITIKITKTSSKVLAEIAKVEFLNNVYEEVPTPKMEIPTNVQVLAESEKLTVTYNQMANITGYEILLQQKQNGVIIRNQVYQTTYTTFTIQDKIDNYTEYSIRVQSVNQEWKSGYSNEILVTPKPTRLPPSVDMVTLNPVYRGFDIGYKKMKDTLSYNIYYRVKGTTQFIKISNIKGTSYNLRDLLDETDYELYVTGNNDLGEGAPSQLVIGKTKTSRATIVPNYKLINTNQGSGIKSLHINDVTYESGGMIAGDKFSIVDNNHDTYWEKKDWDSGVSYANNAPVVAFDDFYTMDRIILTLPENFPYSYSAVAINYWNELGEKTRVSADIQYKKDVNGKGYYLVKTNKPFTADKVQVMVSTYGSGRLIWIDEEKFYYYDSIENDVANLFMDDLRVELKETVTLDTINLLITRANTKDTVSGEYHPNRDVILADLDYATKLYNDEAIQDTIIVDQTISNSYNTSLGFAMSISDLQPLGVVSRPGEKLVVYVGTKGNVMPQLVFTQFYAEANVWKQHVIDLKKGQNIIDVPQIGTASDERGGSVYIKYPNNTVTSEIKVRVSGGTKIPVLDIHDLKDELSIKNEIRTYIEQLTTHINSLPNIYKEQGLTYNNSSSTLNATEVVTRNGLFSVAGSSVLSSLRGTTEEKVNQVYDSLMAFDEMMDFFYRQKGLTSDGDSKNHLPNARINIRYMRMFDGAFMYAGGEHIGIGYGSIAGLFQAKPNQGTGKDMTTTGYFGWGISHEVGHQINQGKLAYAEITNNLYSLLAQTSDDKALSRLESNNMYPNIYEKVTSHTNGMATNVFTALGMYWQLHLAYDTNKTFDDINSITARINILSRNSNLTGSKEDLLLMYASQAAGKDLTQFFQNWGLKLSKEAIEYASKFPKETRSIWFLNDESHRYQLNGGKAMSNDTKVTATLKEDTENKRYTLQFNISKDADTILGYEIIRNGVTIGFTNDNTFVDKIGSLNNRALNYQVIAYDYYLNKTEVYSLDEVKLAHDGSIKKDNFTISSNVKADSDIIDYENPDMDYNKLSVHNLIDQQNNFFNGNIKINSKDTSNPYVIIDLNTTMALSGIKYQAALENGILMKNSVSKYKIYVSKNRQDWTLAKQGTFNLNDSNNYTNLIYFDKEGTTGGNQLWTYDDISYVKIEAVGNTGFSGSEIDLIAPPGDNIEASNDTIGRLTEDYHYLDESGKDAVIKAGSVIFKGDYRGNPAFNVVLLVNAKDDSIVYEGENFLFAKLNSDNDVSEIAKGYWFYAMSEEQYNKVVGNSIRAELYRVDNALTNDGQRLTSTSLSINNLPAYKDLKDMQIIDSTKGE